MHKLLKISVIYSLATGFTRGAVIIYVLVITKYFSLEEFGNFNLAQLLIQLLAPFLSLNSATAVLREGLENKNSGLYLHNYFSAIAIILSALAFPFFFALKNTGGYWILLSLVIAIWEGQFNCNFSILRYLEKHTQFLLLSVIKISCITAAFFYLASHAARLEKLLEYQLYINLGLTCLVYLALRAGTDLKPLTRVNIKEVFKYTLPLIPHSIGQWVMNSSNRFQLKQSQGLTQVGLFSVGVNVSLLVNLFNSGLSMVLPNLFMKNYEEWKAPKKLNRFFVNYSIVIFVIVQCIMLGYFIDMRFTGVMKYYSRDIVWVIFLNCIGYYYLGFYFIYTNFLFYLKKTNSIAISTALCAALNIALTWLLLRHYSFVSASVSSAICYFIYFILIKFSAEKKEPPIKEVSRSSILISLITTVLLLASCLLWLNLF